MKQNPRLYHAVSSCRTSRAQCMLSNISCNILQCSPQNSQPQLLSLRRPAPWWILFVLCKSGNHPMYRWCNRWWLICWGVHRLSFCGFQRFFQCLLFCLVGWGLCSDKRIQLILGFLRKRGIVDTSIYDPVFHYGHFNPCHMIIHHSWYDPVFWIPPRWMAMQDGWPCNMNDDYIIWLLDLAVPYKLRLLALQLNTGVTGHRQFKNIQEVNHMFQRWNMLEL